MTGIAILSHHPRIDVSASERDLLRENERLRERIDQLQDVLCHVPDASPCFRLSPHEAVLFGLLMKRQVVTSAMAMIVMYAAGPESDCAQQSNIRVWVCRMRRKLAAFGLDIQSGNQQQGYWMTPDTKAKARSIIEVYREAAR